MATASDSGYRACDLQDLDLVTLTRDGESIEMRIDQDPWELLFMSLDPGTIWLKELYGPRAFFPDANNRFIFSSEVGSIIISLRVEGSAAQMSSNVTLSSSSPTTSQLRSSYSQFGQTASNLSAAITAHRAKESRCNVKIVNAIMSWKDDHSKPTFFNERQEHVDVTEATANVVYVNSAIRSKFGDDFVVVTADGLKIEDSSGTQGLKFWKVGSRKLFAVRQQDLYKPSETPRRKSCKRAAMVCPGSDTEDDWITD